MYLIVPNLPVWLFEKKLWLHPHGLFNVECLIVGISSIFLSRRLTFLLLALEIFSSFLYLICFTYQFSLSNLWTSLQFLTLLPVGEIYLYLAVLTVILALSALVAYAAPRPVGRSRKVFIAVQLVLVALLVSFDTFDGRNPAWPKDVSEGMPRVTISPLIALSKRGWQFRSVEASAHSAHDEYMDSASAKATAFLDRSARSQRPDVVLVLVESWGLLHDTDLASGIVGSYRSPSIAKEYRVSSGTVPFDGLTVPGEARELCHSHLGFGLLDISPTERSNCLPAQFHASGYQNIAIHGYVGQMFERAKWYASIGFDQRWFGPDLGRLGLNSCDGAFSGICDGAIAEWIGRSLLSDRPDLPKFIYWVTLNSHLPVPQNPDLPPDQTCRLHAELSNSDAFCSWFRLVSAVHSSVQKLALEPRAKPTVFILVGDHAPPFADPQIRQMFSDTEVPYVILEPIARPHF
jgi:Sulfatase